MSDLEHRYPIFHVNKALMKVCDSCTVELIPVYPYVHPPCNQTAGACHHPHLSASMCKVAGTVPTFMYLSFRCKSTDSTIISQTCPYSYNRACKQPWGTQLCMSEHAEDMPCQGHSITLWLCYGYTTGYIVERTGYTGKDDKSLEGEGCMEEARQKQTAWTGTYSLWCPILSFLILNEPW